MCSMPMSKGFNYRDALILLTGKDSTIAEFVDSALGGAVIGSSLIFGPVALGLLGPNSELIRLSKSQLEGLSAKLAGRRVVERTDMSGPADPAQVMSTSPRTRHEERESKESAAGGTGEHPTAVGQMCLMLSEARFDVSDVETRQDPSNRPHAAVETIAS